MQNRNLDWQILVDRRYVTVSLYDEKAGANEFGV